MTAEKVEALRKDRQARGSLYVQSHVASACSIDISTISSLAYRKR